MRLHRFYLAEKIGSKKELVIDSPELVNQISRVFRLGTGDKVIVFDGSGNDFECEIIREASPREGVSCS
jgi:16S rRNA U1498 N3-methylase RsmE